MKVILAEKAGFCFGVQRAMDLVREQIACGRRPIFTYGPMIHNEEVVKDLKAKGVEVMEAGKDVDRPGTIIIRSHGVTRAQKEALDGTGADIVDGTCPFVTRIHDIVKDHAALGEQILVIGDPLHPEVIGICGWAKNQTPLVIQNREEARALRLPEGTRACLVAQTTFNLNKFQEMIEIIGQKGYDIRVCNTICAATRQRQEAAQALAHEVDAMIVIGGKESSNTRKLFDLCSEICPNTFLIQTKDDLDPADFHSFDCVGITAGASTPNNIIEEVQNHVRKF